MSAESWACGRCGAEGPRLTRPPFGGELGAEISEKVCAACWGEWQRAEVMVINELRLNFMDPAAQEVLTAHLRDFLALGPAAPAP
ncbi:MAG: Fe(2+)-trafficking protein [Holophagales bacterium]|nr:Fe(2+)-trafficking protein [Holophagales bacterium]